MALWSGATRWNALSEAARTLGALDGLCRAVAVAYATATLVASGADMNDWQIQELVFTINDTLARNPRFAAMSAMQKQNDADGLIFQSVVISVLREMGARDPQARQQSMELARVVLKQLNGA